MGTCNGRPITISIDSDQWDFVSSYPGGWEEVDTSGWIRTGDSYIAAIQADRIRWNSQYGKAAKKEKGESAAES